MNEGYYGKRIVGVSSKLCLCGCGEFLPLHAYKSKNHPTYYTAFSFIKGHHKRGVSGFNSEIHLPRLCECGCGQYTKKFGGKYNRFIKKHENIGRIAWNKGKPFSIKSRKKMSIARLGKEPVNKLPVDLNKIKEFYFDKMLTRQETAKLLGISVCVVKTRVKFLRGKLNDPYHSPEFLKRMRKIGVELFKKWGYRDGPNKLEQLVYSTLDKYKIEYQKQVPLFDKFVVDAFFPKEKLILEIFGDYWHKYPRTIKKDEWKKKFLKNRGYQIEEIWERDIKQRGVELVMNKFIEKYKLI